MESELALENDTGVDMSAVNEAASKMSNAKTTVDGLPADMDSILDEALEAIPDKLREGTGVAKAAKKEETPPDEEEEAAKEAKAGKEEESKEPDYRLEKALAALRFAKVPSDVIDNLGRAKLLAWGTELAEGQAKTAEKLQKQAEELKTARAPKAETTEVVQPIPDLDKAMQAFSEYGDDFKKPLGEFGRAVHKAARESVMSEIQPAAQVVAEIRDVLIEMVNESMRRELGERFPKIVEGPENFGKAEAAFKRLWGPGGESYADAAPTKLGRLRAAWNDAAKLTFAEEPGTRKDDTVKKAQRIPPGPARQAPRKNPTQDEVVDESLDEVMKRWAPRR